MKKKAELSRKSYLLKHLKSMSVYKLIVNTFNGFVYIEFDQTLDILQSKKLIFFIQITGGAVPWPRSPGQIFCVLELITRFLNTQRVFFTITRKISGYLE